MKAPAEASFFRIQKLGVPLLIGAAQFSDVREADFSKCISRFDREGLDLEIVEEHYDDAFLPSVWLLGLFALMLGGWYACGRENLG